MHLNALEALGATFETSHGYVEGRVDSSVMSRPRLIGTHVVLEYPSHTATDNVLMAAVLAKGTTVIENAAREPEIADLADYLNTMGARVSGAGTSRLEVEGVEESGRAPHRSSPTGWWPPPSSPPPGWPAGTWSSRTPGPTTWTCCCGS